MKSVAAKQLNEKQRVAKELLVGTLVYVCILGFLNDYTDIVYAKSFSLLFLAAVVLECLTFLTLVAKKKVLVRFDKNAAFRHKAGVLFGAWLILFFSKFVFIGVIDVVFNGTVTIYGFFNILLVVLAVTVIQKLTDLLFQRLGE